MGKGGLLIAGFIATTFILFAVRVLPRVLGSVGTALAARRWPRTKGRVLISQVVLSPMTATFARKPGEFSEPTPAFSHALEYEYRVGSRSFRGTRRFAQVIGTAGTRESAMAAAQAYPVGAEVEVLYNPENPSDAALETSVHWGHFFTLAVVLAFGAIGLFVLKSAVQAWRALP